jgi:hypothetical protein
MVPILMANFARLKKALSARAGQRFGDQYGMLLAGYSILIQDGEIADEDAERIVTGLGLEDEKEIARESDHLDALDHLLTSRIKLDIGNNVSKDFTFSAAIREAFTDDVINKSLQYYGVLVRSTEKDVSIASKHAALEVAVFRGSRWSEKWANALARLPGAQKNVPAWIDGGAKKSTRLPLSILP